MNYKFIKIKPLIYTLAALLVLYFVFHIKQKVSAQNTNRENTSQRRQNAPRDNRHVRQSTNSPRAASSEERAPNEQTSANSAGQNENASNQTARASESTEQNNQSSSGGTNAFERRFNEAANSQRQQAQRKNPAFGFLEILFVLLILGLGFYLFYRYFSKKKEGNISTTDYISVLSTTPLAAGKHLQVIQIFDRVYILGVGENSINLITEVTDQNLIVQMRSDAAKRLPSLSFKEQILKFIHKMKLGASVKNDPEEEALSFFKNQREKLNSLNGKNKDTSKDL